MSKFSSPLIGAQLSLSKVTIADNFCMQISAHGEVMVFMFYNCDCRAHTTHRMHSFVFTKEIKHSLGLSRRVYFQVRGKISMPREDFDKIMAMEKCAFKVVLEKHSRPSNKPHNNYRQFRRQRKAFSFQAI